MKVILLLAISTSAGGFLDGINSFVSRTPSTHEAEIIQRSLEIAAQTSAGRKIGEELGLDASQQFTRQNLEQHGVSIRISRFPLRGDWANTRSGFLQLVSFRPTTSVITISNSVMAAPPELLAPLIVHELVHAGDRRKGYFAPSERRAYLFQIHAILELDERRHLPAVGAAEGITLKMLRDFRRLLRIYKGLPLPHDRYGSEFRTLSYRADVFRAENPGVRALVAHVKLRQAVGESAGGWDLSGDPPLRVKEYYAAIEREDIAFRAEKGLPIVGRDQEVRIVAAPADPPEGAIRVIAARVEPPESPIGPVAETPYPIVVPPSLSRGLLNMAREVCSSSGSSMLSAVLSPRWLRASGEEREDVRAVRNQLQEPCIKRVLTGILDKPDFTDEDLRHYAHPPAARSGDGGRPRPCIPRGIWSKQGC